MNLVQFPSSSRRYYTLQRCLDLQAGVWTNVPGQVDHLGASGIDTMQDAAASNRQNYRVLVEVSP